MEVERGPPPMTRIAEILTAEMTDAEKTALANIAFTQTNLCETSVSKLSELRLIELSPEQGGAIKLTKLGIQVFGRF